jgi:hypothetical protein
MKRGDGVTQFFFSSSFFFSCDFSLLRVLLASCFDFQLRRPFPALSRFVMFMPALPRLLNCSQRNGWIDETKTEKSREEEPKNRYDRDEHRRRNVENVMPKKRRKDALLAVYVYAIWTGRECEDERERPRTRGTRYRRREITLKEKVSRGKKPCFGELSSR